MGGRGAHGRQRYSRHRGGTVVQGKPFEKDGKDKRGVVFGKRSRRLLLSKDKSNPKGL